MEFSIFHVNAFTNNLFGGNPTAVCILGDIQRPPDHNHMIKIAKGSNFSETVFCFKDAKRKNSYFVYFFSPEGEVGLCGHGTLATAHVIFNFLRESNISQTENTIDIHSHLMGSLHVTRVDQLPDQVAGAVRFKTPKEVLKSRDFVLVFDCQKAVEDIDMDEGVLRNMEINCAGIVVTAPATIDNECDFVSRYFNCNKVHIEDFATGSSHCSLAPYWSEKLNKKKLRAKQMSKRIGTLFCEVGSDHVVIAGHAVTFSHGYTSSV